MQVGRQRARRQHQAADTHVLRCKQRHDILEIFRPAAHAHSAQRLALVRRRWRQNTDRQHFFDGTALDGAQQHFRIRRHPDQKRRHRIGPTGLLLRARVPEQAVSEPRPAEEGNLQAPIECNRDLAKEIGAVECRIKQDIIEHEQRHCKHGDRAQDVPQIRQRGEAPLAAIKLEDPINRTGIGQVERQIDEQPVQPLIKAAVLEADIKCRQQRQSGDDQIVYDDQDATRVAQEIHHHVIIVQAVLEDKTLISAR